jgi:hypothetical protein
MGDHEAHKGHVVALGKKILNCISVPEQSEEVHERKEE